MPLRRPKEEREAVKEDDDSLPRLLDLKQGIRRLRSGERPLALRRDTLAGHSVDSELTGREQEVLLRLADGDTEKEIAADLRLSPHTVHSHGGRLRLKLAARNKAHAVAIGFRKRLLR